MRHTNCFVTKFNIVAQSVTAWSAYVLNAAKKKHIPIYMDIDDLSACKTI